MADSHYVLKPQQHPRALDVVGTKVTILATASDNGGYGITFQQGEQGSGPPPHTHDWHEAFYVVSGTVDFHCAGEEYTCPQGTLVHIPRNTVHGFSYGSGGGSMIEVTSSDGTSAEMFTAFDAHIDADTDLATTLALLKDNGVQVAS